MFCTLIITLLLASVATDVASKPDVVVVIGAVVYAGLAKWVFDRGLRSYASGNRMLELR